MKLGQQELERMIASQHLEPCSPDPAGASALISKARTHHRTAAALAATDPEIAADALHAGNRKALEAVLLARGLRPTKLGGHLASFEAVTAMLGGNGVLRVYNVVRRVRHEGDYSSASFDVQPDDIEDNLDDSEAMVDACEKMIPLVPPFVNGRA